MKASLYVFLFKFIFKGCNSVLNKVWSVIGLKKKKSKGNI